MSLFVHKFIEKSVKRYINDDLWLTCNLFDHYMYLEYYDEGGYSSVHKVMSIKSGEHLILKRSSKKDFVSGTIPQLSDTAKSDTTKLNELKVSQEAEFMVKVHQHLNGLKLYDYYDQENYYILIMEYGGRSLENITTCHKKKILNLTRYEAYSTNYFYTQYLLQIKLYMIKVYHKIKKIYKLGIHHNDLKPENILIDDGQVNIIDFGVAKYVKPFYTEYKGTLEYLPYEYIANGIYKPWDHTIWSFGIMLHFFTLMKYPFLKEEDILNYNLDVTQIQKLPSTFSDLIIKCLDKNPENRPQNILEMLGNLNAVY
jgi:serine/threonine protein kinase